ncbi:hypothetical protein C8F01DRAFT_1230708 [Mycena amicta]|nr:hypothetical protein C8F01DRAFT_1230708 [Mycena amicta]
MPAVFYNTTSDTVTGAELNMPPLIECPSTSRVSFCTAIFVFLILLFYALALWDRWLNLKLRETNLREKRALLVAQTSPRFYGTTSEPSTPKNIKSTNAERLVLPEITITPPPSPPASPKHELQSERRPWDNLSVEVEPTVDNRDSALLTPPRAHVLSDVSS